MNKQQTFVPRITQLDATEFDKEIYILLKNNLLEISQFLNPGSLNNVQPEIGLLVRFLIFKYSLMKGTSTFGQDLLNVQFNKKLTGKSALLFFSLNQVVPYLKDKFDDTPSNWKNENIRTAVDSLAVAIKILQFLNLLIFLKEGTYPNLVNRLLGLKIVPKARLNRNAGYTYMIRELLWHGFMELFKFTLPLINYGHIKRKILTKFSRKSTQSLVPKHVDFKITTVCCICGDSPIYPCQFSVYCSHVACYYCLKSNILADNEYACPNCGIISTAYTNLEFLQNKIIHK